LPTPTPPAEVAPENI
jgi:hypothetical protein